MPALPVDRLLVALVILLAITLLGWLSLFVTEIPARALGALLLCTAFLKVQIIITRFMELGTAWRPVRLAFHAWFLFTAGVTLALYLR